MSTPVIAVTTEATIDEAAALMMECGFTTLPVVSAASGLIGLLTEADLGAARYTHATTTPDDGAIAGVNPRLVRQIMRAPTLTVPADAELTDLAAAMVDSQQRCLPVVEHGRVVGIVSWRDLLPRLADSRDIASH